MHVNKSEEKFVPQVFGFKIHGKNGSVNKPVLHQEKVSPEPVGQEKSLAKTSVSRHKNKPNKKNK